MIALAAVALVLLAVAAVLWSQLLRANHRIADVERARATAENRLATRGIRATEAAHARPADDWDRFLGVLTHELRTPLGAIIGFQELLAEGLLGPLDPRGRDAVNRIGASASQLRHLLDGLSDLIRAPSQADLEPGEIDTGQVVAQAVASARVLAASRNVQLELRVSPSLPTLHTDENRVAMALDLAFGAAIRGSPGRTLALGIHADADTLAAEVTGTALDPAADSPPADVDIAAVPPTAAGLRLAMAERALRLLGGELGLRAADEGAIVWLRIPSLPIDGSRPPA